MLRWFTFSLFRVVYKCIIDVLPAGEHNRESFTRVLPATNGIVIDPNSAEHRSHRPTLISPTSSPAP
eukprot:scaffold677226_cov74-Prasinocladus_malaysianus.AAC.1